MKKFKNAIQNQLKASTLFLKSVLLFSLTFTITFSSCKKPKEETGDNGKSSGKTDQTTDTAASGDEFTIAVIPDTQYYMEQDQGGTFQMFKDQIDWIKANRVSENIVYVAGLGDIVDNGDFKSGSYPDSNKVEWERAKYYYQLETPFSGNPHGIPYGLAVGNHDQTGHEYPLSFSNPNIGFTTNRTTGFYNKYFGVSHFAGRSYYGGSYTAVEANNNDSHYDLITAGGLNLIIIYLEYDQKINQYGTQLEDWAYNLLGTHSSRKAIVVIHALAGNNATPGTNVGTPPSFYSRAGAIYNRLKTRKNLFLMLGGHIVGNGEGYRMDTYQGSTVKSYVSGYQGRTNGGNGWMRLMTFSKNNDLIKVRTYSPTLGTWETDDDSQFTRPMFRHPTAMRVFDFDNNGKSQLAFYTNGVWAINGMSNINYGTSGYIAVPADYDGDGKTDVGVYNPNNNNWAVNHQSSINFGTSGDIPVPGDYDGDGRADIAVWRPSNATWYVRGITTQQYGMSNHVPVPADYNGDGKVDFAVFNKNSGNWASTAFETLTYGQAGDIPVPADYNGDGKVEIGVFRPSTGNWDSPTMSPTHHGQAGDIPIPGDYLGNGTAQLAVYRPSNNTLYVKNGPSVVLNGDQLLNMPYHIRHFFFP